MRHTPKKSFKESLLPTASFLTFHDFSTRTISTAVTILKQRPCTESGNPNINTKKRSLFIWILLWTQQSYCLGQKLIREKRYLWIVSLLICNNEFINPTSFGTGSVNLAAWEHKLLSCCGGSERNLHYWQHILHFSLWLWEAGSEADRSLCSPLTAVPVLLHPFSWSWYFLSCCFPNFVLLCLVISNIPLILEGQGKIPLPYKLQHTHTPVEKRCTCS